MDALAFAAYAEQRRSLLAPRLYPPAQQDHRRRGRDECAGPAEGTDAQPRQFHHPFPRPDLAVVIWAAFHVSRAQRTAKWCAAEPGPLRTPPLGRSRLSGAPRRETV